MDPQPPQLSPQFGSSRFHRGLALGGLGLGRRPGLGPPPSLRLGGGRDSGTAGQVIISIHFDFLRGWNNALLFLRPLSSVVLHGQMSSLDLPTHELRPPEPLLSTAMKQPL